MPDDYFDAVITDPPYSSGGQFRSDKNKTTGDKYTTAGKKSKYFHSFPGDNRDQRSYSYWLNLVLTECYRVSKTGSMICLFIDWRQLPLMSDIFQSAGFVWRGIYVWDKTRSSRPRPGYFRQQAEFVMWGSKGPITCRNGFKSLPGVTTCSVRSGGRFHQTGKPVNLMKDIVSICDEYGTVLDPFMGSGSTGVACAETERSFVGIEYTEHYHSVAFERLKKAYGVK